MPNYPYTFQLPPLNVQDIPNDGAPGEFLGINVGGQLDWLPAGGGGSGDMLKSENLSGLADYAIARTNIGLGTTSTPTFANLTLTSPSLSSSAPVTISQTWNGTGSTVFKALVVNATTPGTTSSSSSLLLDLQVGGVSTASINKSGQFYAGSTAQLLSLIQSDAYIRNASSGRAASLWADECRIVGGPLVFSDSHNVNISTISAGVALYKEAANTLALRNGAAAQTFRVYNTYTDASNWEVGFLSFSSNIFNVGTHASGSGSFRKLAFYGNGIDFNQSNVGLRWSINPAGNFLAGSDNAYDIGTGGALGRPKNIYAGSNIYAAGNVGIGTTAPSANLELYGNSGQTVLKITSVNPGTGSNLIFNGPFGQLNNNTGSFFITNESATDPVIFRAGGQVERMRITASGNVGIGTTAPVAKLEVAGTIHASGWTGVQRIGGSAQGGYMYARGAVEGSNFGNPLGNGVVEISTNAPGLIIGTTGAGSMVLGTNQLERVRILSTGEVGIGTTSPTSKLHVVGDELITGNSSLNNGLFNTNTTRVAGLIPFQLGTSSYLGFTANYNPDASPPDTILLRDGEPYHLATRNGTNGQKFSVYGTYPGAAWERFTITAPTSGNVLLGTYKGTGGIARGLELQTDGVTRMTISTGNDVTFSGSLTFGAIGQLRFLSTGVAMITNAAQTDFGRLCLGGNTATAPALKRSTTYLQARLADDSAFTHIQGKLTTDTAFDATVVTPTGFITLYDSTGTAYKVPCVPA